MIRGAGAAASREAARAGADAALASGATAVDALLAGFFADAGAEPGVLFSPAIAIVAGTGAGARAFDGRALQPGRDAARPRGFVSDEDIPKAAHASVPRSLPMLALAHAYRGRSPLRELVRAGVAEAEARHASDRAELLRRIGAQGVRALSIGDTAHALVQAGGKTNGGTLTEADLEQAAPGEETACVVAPAGGRAHVSPWNFDAAAADVQGPSSNAEVLIVADGRGIFAALAYTPAFDGLEVPSLGVRLPLGAFPVRRGVEKVAAGTPLIAAAPIAITFGRENTSAVLGLSGASLLADAVFERVWQRPVESAVGDLRAETGARGVALILVDARGHATVVSANG